MTDIEAKIDRLVQAFNEKARVDSEFRGQMLEFKATTERRLAEGNERMGDIEKSIATVNPTCVFHQEMVDWRTKKDAKDAEQDKAQGEIKTAQAVQEYKLTALDLTKMATLAGVIAAPISELLKLIIITLTTH